MNRYMLAALHRQQERPSIPVEKTAPIAQKWIKDAAPVPKTAN